MCDSESVQKMINMSNPLELEDVWIQPPPSKNLKLFEKQLKKIFAKYGVSADTDFFRAVFGEVKRLYETVASVQWLIHRLKEPVGEEQEKAG